MFKIGQKVVCKNTAGFEHSMPHGIRLNKIYTVVKIGTCVCGQETLYLKEATAMTRFCGTMDVSTGFHAAFYSYRFEPLVGSWVEALLERLSVEIDEEERIFTESEKELNLVSV